MRPELRIDIAPLPVLPEKKEEKKPFVVIIDMGYVEEEEESGIIVMDISGTEKRA